MTQILLLYLMFWCNEKLVDCIRRKKKANKLKMFFKEVPLKLLQWKNIVESHHHYTWLNQEDSSPAFVNLYHKLHHDSMKRSYILHHTTLSCFSISILGCRMQSPQSWVFPRIPKSILELENSDPFELQDYLKWHMVWEAVYLYGAFSLS